MVASDGAHLRLRPRLERIRQHVDAQARPPGIGGHGVGQVLELRCHDDDRRLALGRHADGVVDAPGRAGASVAQPDDGDVDIGDEVLELHECPLPLVADAIAGAPRTDARAGGDQAL